MTRFNEIQIQFPDKMPDGVSPYRYFEIAEPSQDGYMWIGKIYEDGENVGNTTTVIVL